MKDYYVAYSLDQTHKSNGFPAKSFYWCSSSTFVFASLPKPLDQLTAEFNELNVFFSGEHDRVVLDKPVSAPVVVDAEEGIIIPAKYATELNRLSHVVSQIENNCAVVPRGSYKFNPLKETVQNEAFRGLN